MNYSEMMSQMEKVGMNGGSQLHLRSEELQKKQTIARIPRLKNKLKKKSLILIPAELAFPFNPETGKADEVFNMSTKFRPSYNAKSVALAMKDKANQIPALKEKLMKTAGITEWDTSDIETLTKLDQQIFNHYRVPRIFSVSAVHIDIPVMGTGTFGRDYAITIKRDEEMNVIGEKPLCLLAYEFFRARAYEEVSEYRKAIDKGDIADTDQQQRQKISNIYGRVPVSDDKPKNFIIAYEIPLNKDGTINEDDVNFGEFSAEKVKPFEVISNYKSKIRKAIENYQNGDWAKFDQTFDFYAIQMNCPADGDDSTMQGKAKLGQDTEFERPVAPLHSTDEYGIDGGKFKTDSLIDAVGEYIAGDLEVEKRARRSMGITMYTDQVESMLSSSIKSVIDLDSDKYITKEVIKNHKDFLSLVMGDEGLEAIEEVEAEVSDREDGVLDEGAAKKDQKEYSISELDAVDDDLADDIEDEMGSLDLAAAEVSA